MLSSVRGLLSVLLLSALFLNSSAVKVIEAILNALEENVNHGQELATCDELMSLDVDLSMLIGEWQTQEAVPIFETMTPKVRTVWESLDDPQSQQLVCVRAVVHGYNATSESIHATVHGHVQGLFHPTFEATVWKLEGGKLAAQLDDSTSDRKKTPGLILMADPTRFIVHVQCKLTSRSEHEPQQVVPELVQLIVRHHVSDEETRNIWRQIGEMVRMDLQHDHIYRLGLYC